MDIRLSFIILPSSLAIKNFKSPALPDPLYGYSEKEYELTIFESYSIVCLGPSEVSLNLIKKDNAHNQYRLYVPRSVSRIQLQIINEITSETMEVELPTKQLIWDVYENHKQIDKKNEYISITQQELEENDYRLFINTRTFKPIEELSYLTVTFYLRSSKGQNHQVITRKIHAGSGVPVLLNTFKDTILQEEESNFNIWLKIDHFLLNPIPIVKINKKWVIRNLSIVPNGERLFLNWDENMKIENRVLRIWDESHPWHSFEEIKIDNDIYSINLPWKDKPIGTYLFEWSTSNDDDFFSFLEEIKYPKISPNSMY